MLSNFEEFRNDDIQNNPNENLDQVMISDDTYYYSPIGSNENGTYLWESLSDPSFTVASTKQLFNDNQFMGIYLSELIQNEIPAIIKDENEFKVSLRHLMDETLGFGLPFTLLDANQFTKELEYYNAKRKNKS